MAALVSQARAVLGTAPREKRVETRMQVPTSEDLHRRLQQFAALRSQTLGASMLDILETHAPAI